MGHRDRQGGGGMVRRALVVQRGVYMIISMMAPDKPAFVTRVYCVYIYIL